MWAFAIALLFGGLCLIFSRQIVPVVFQLTESVGSQVRIILLPIGIGMILSGAAIAICQV